MGWGPSLHSAMVLGLLTDVHVQLVRKPNCVERIGGEPVPFHWPQAGSRNNLYYFRARYVDQSTGRFLSEDPLSFRRRTQNLYTYTQTNPINFKDPLGWAPDGNCTDCKGQPNQLLDPREELLQRHRPDVEQR